MKSLFIESFRKLDKSFVYVVLLDFLFYAGLIICFIALSKLLIWSIGSLYELPGKLTALSRMESLEQLGSNAEGAAMLLQQFKAKLMLSLVMFWLLVVVVFTVFKAPAWSFVTGLKLSRKLFVHALRFNLLWFGAIALLGIFLFFVSRPAVAGIVLMILFFVAAYLTPVSYSLLNPRKKMAWVLKKLWHVAFERIYLFIVPAVISFAVLALVLILVTAVIINFVPEWTLLPLFVVFVLWQSWCKYYIYLIVRKIR